jgi:hypothetical protein
MLFNHVSVGVASPRASVCPSQVDCDTVLSMLNTDSFHARDLPVEDLVEFLSKNVWSQPDGTICHTAARILANKLGWKKVSGYLCKNRIEIDYLTKRLPDCETSPNFIRTSSKQVITCLNHHSVVVDSQGNYIECTPEGWYPIDEFLFIPHSSGHNGWSLYAIQN